ncbi:MAG TPA: GAF domain-containing SpoIIE family protein phosphatase, partial [Mycobacteriales bacterium]|nr:GAF domain-containing SpoIIE family protein phosphatase [Mycobacteriales bacterium]
RRLARMVVPLLAEICIVDVVEAGDQVRQIAVIPSERAPAEPEPIPQGPDAYARVLRGQNQLVRIPVESGEDSRARLLADLGARCAVTVGLRARNRVLGALTLGGPEPISEADLALLEELAGRAALALDNIRLYQLQRHAAESLQASMLTRLPEPAGLRLAARYAPASEGVDIGGDWYDAFCLPDDVTMVAVGDVAGHDLRAAGRMGQLRAMLRTLAYDRMDPPSVLLQRLDRALAGLGADTMATAVLAALEPAGESWRLRWSSAGHLPPVLLHADGTSETVCGSAADLMLGVEVDRPRHVREQSLQPGDTLLLYTDGVVETRDTPPEQGLVRLRHLAARSVPAGIEQLCDSVIADVADHGGNDDAALIAVQLASADGSAAARRR